jgi:plasmid stability protein
MQIIKDRGVSMANVNVRGLSDKTKEALRVRAAKAGMSLEAYARRALTKASMANGDEPKPVVELAEKIFWRQARRRTRAAATLDAAQAGRTWLT